jgi:pectate lyase
MGGLVSSAGLTRPSLAIETVFGLHYWEDAYEPNDDFFVPFDLADHGQDMEGLSIFPLGDVDYFLWSGGPTSGSVTITVYENMSGPLTLIVYKNNTSPHSSSDPGSDTESITLPAAAGEPFTIIVQSANNDINSDYRLKIEGTATNGTNRCPVVAQHSLTVNEAEAGYVWPLHDPPQDYDPDGDILALLTHSDLFGRATVEGGYFLKYLPATSITNDTIFAQGESHFFTYVVDDGRGGRTKGRVDVSVNALQDGTAFPNAEGFGAYASGGRLGDVYVVTSVADTDTPGTLRYGVTRRKQGVPHRTVVFDVAGPIQVQQQLPLTSRLTIAGETAPVQGVTAAKESALGEGVTIFGNSSRTGKHEPLVMLNGIENVIVRYLRMRDVDRFTVDAENGVLKPNYNMDTVKIINAEDVIFDHCSISWGNDETLEVWNSSSVSVQWCIISEGLSDPTGTQRHAMGTMLQQEGSCPSYVTLHHNLWAHHDARMPKIVNKLRTDMVNNVMYNWGSHSDRATRIGTWRFLSGAPNEGDTDANVVNNYYKPGNNSDINDAAVAISPEDTSNNPHKKNRVYFEGNEFPDGSTVPIDIPVTNVERVTGAPIDIGIHPAIDPKEVSNGFSTASTAYAHVKNSAGASLVRDSTDLRIISDLENGTGWIKFDVPAGEGP